MVKQLVGGDTVTARKLRQNSFEYIPQFKMIMNTNHLCRINDSTMFYGNKIIVISFLFIIVNLPSVNETLSKPFFIFS